MPMSKRIGYSIVTGSFLISIFWVSVTTFIMGAVCQRWVTLVKALGFISLIGS